MLTVRWSAPTPEQGSANQVDLLLIRGWSRETFVVAVKTLMWLNGNKPLHTGCSTWTTKTTWPDSQFTVIIHLWNLLCKKKLPLESFQTFSGLSCFFLDIRIFLDTYTYAFWWKSHLKMDESIRMYLLSILLNIVAPYFLQPHLFCFHNYCRSRRFASV